MSKQMDKRAKDYLVILSVALAMVMMAGQAVADSVTFNWGGSPIVSGDDPNYNPSGEAVFELSGSTLTLKLTNTTAQTTTGRSQVLQALLWDIDDSNVSLSAVSAYLGAGSVLVGDAAEIQDFADIGNNLSGQWAFKDDISAGGGLGSFGVGSSGDINFGADGFGNHDIIDDSVKLINPAPGGMDFGLINSDVDYSGGGLQQIVKNGPLVQSSVVFTFDVIGQLDINDIGNVQGLYGTTGSPTDGTKIAPLPAGVWAGSAMLGSLAIVRKMRRRNR